MNLGEKIKKLRKDNDLSQEQLAEKLNISRQSISKWESGKAYPDIDNLKLLKDIFNISIDELLSDENTKSLKEELKESFIEEKAEVNKDEDDESLSETLILSGFIIGIGIGVITNNFMWGTAAGFIGFGIGEVLQYIKKHKK